MKNVIFVLQREIAVYFASPLAYAILAVFLFINGVLFCNQFVFTRLAELDWLVSFNRFALIFAAPLLTMRLISEERRSGTFEMAMTAPLTEAQWVIGKYLGALAFYMLMILPTLLYLIAFRWFGATGTDLGQLAATYLGLFLHGAMYIAVGVFFSAISSNQILAALYSIVFIYMMSLLPSVFYNRAPENLMRSVSYLSFSSHAGDFGRGIVSTRDVFYLISVSALFLYLSARAVAFRRWV